MTKSGTKKIHVLHYSTHNENCGIGKYQEQFIAGADPAVYNEFFPYSPHTTKVMSHEEFSGVLAELKAALEDFDILHIQHEFSFYLHSELQRIIDLAHSLRKKVVITVHTAPSGHYTKPKLGGIGPRSILHYARKMKTYLHLEKVHISAIKKADLLLVHNTSTYNDLVARGIAASKIKKIVLPVPAVQSAEESHEIRQALSAKKGDIILATVGFVSPSKGTEHALKALTLLPENYKLAIVGGVHPNSLDQSYLDKVCDLARKLGVQNRLYITGYVEDDERLNSLVAECAIGVYPYDKKYYAYVTSGALSNSFASHLPIIAYPTDPVIEINKEYPVIAITKSANYYELARTIKAVNLQDYSGRSARYAKEHSYSREAQNIAHIYQDLVR